MPYVQVWVDECNGDCGASAKVNALKEMIEEAAELLEECRTADALELLTQPSARPAKVKAEYAAIQAGKSPWFRLYGQSIASGGLQ